MVERKPADGGVGRSQLDPRDDGADVREQVGVRQHDTLGVTRTTRRVLDQGDVIRLTHRGRGRFAAVSERVRRNDGLERPLFAQKVGGQNFDRGGRGGASDG